MHSTERIGWGVAVLAALAVVVVTFIPQILFMVNRGSEWQGSYVFVDPDELAYSAYLNSIILGRSRRNNPYLGDGTKSAGGKNENLFSIQFFPPFLLKLVANTFALSASSIFILMLPIAVFASSLAIFLLLLDLMGDNTTAALGVLTVLLCGIIVSEHVWSPEKHYYTFAFLRRYIPAVAFPLFFLFCLFVWKAFNRQRKDLLLFFLAGLTLSLLVYSYFYLWTAAAAWFACLTLLWLVARPMDWERVSIAAATITMLALGALVPYFYLLRQRADPIDVTHGLIVTRMPDLLRSTEVVGGLIMAVLVWYAFRGRINWRSPSFLFAASCFTAPFVIFNQQIITGYSLQPFHYEQFIINYVVLLGAVVSYFLIRRRPPERLVLWIAVALGIGFATAFRSSAVTFDMNERSDAAVPIYHKLEEYSQQKTGVALFENPILAAAAPTHSSVSVLWAPHMYAFGTISSAEEVERFYQYLYFAGVDASQLSTDPGLRRLFTMTLFGLVRVNPKLSVNFQPVTESEIGQQIDAYSAYTRSFSQEHANRWPLSFIVWEDDGVCDLSTVDRWYERDSGYRIGRAIIYRVQLRTDKFGQSESNAHSRLPT